MSKIMREVEGSAYQGAASVEEHMKRMMYFASHTDGSEMNLSLRLILDHLVEIEGARV